MTGRHGDRDDEASLNLLRTGPIVVRGMARGVRGALLPGPNSRHRATAPTADGAAVTPGVEGTGVDAEQSAPQTAVGRSSHLDGSEGSGADLDPEDRQDRQVLAAATKAGTDQDDDLLEQRGMTADRAGAGQDAADAPEESARASEDDEQLSGEGTGGPVRDGAPFDAGAQESPGPSAVNLEEEPDPEGTTGSAADADPESTVAGVQLVGRADSAPVPLLDDGVEARPGCIDADEDVARAGLAEDLPSAAPLSMTAPAAGESDSRNAGGRSRPLMAAGAAGSAPSDPTRLPPPRLVARRDRAGREVVGIAVLILLALVCAGLIAAVVVKTRNDSDLAAREAAAYRPPALTTPSPASTGPVVVVVADEAALRAASGVAAGERWPQLLAQQGAQVTTLAGVGAGYATAGSQAQTFVQAAERVPATADVVLFVGGAADDRVSSLSLARAATQAFSAAAQRAPDAAIVAVGPIFRPATTSTADFEAVRTTLRSASRIADVQWVDPVTSQWVTGVSATSDLSAAKERSMASRLDGLVRRVLD